MFMMIIGCEMFEVYSVDCRNIKLFYYVDTQDDDVLIINFINCILTIPTLFTHHLFFFSFYHIRIIYFEKFASSFGEIA